MAILSLAEFKVFKPDLASGADPRLEVIIDSANDFFLMRVNRDIEETTHTNELIDGDGTNQLILNNYPLTEVTEIKTIDLNDDETLIDSTDYAIYFSSGRIKLKNGSIFPGGIQNIKITYKAGYISANIPKDIKLAISEIVSKKYNQFDKNEESHSSEAFIGGSLVVREEDLTDFASDVINFYNKKGPKAT